MPGFWEALIQPFGPLPDGMRAMHMVHLKTGKILVFGDDTADEQLWTPPAGPFVSVPNPTTDLRCAGHSALADGRLLSAVCSSFSLHGPDSDGRLVMADAHPATAGRRRP